MSAKDLQSRNNTQDAMQRRTRALSLGSQPTLNMLSPRCSSAKPYHTSQGRRHVRSQSESFYFLGTSSGRSLQELCNTQEERKLPKIPQRTKSDYLMNTEPGTKGVLRRSSCVLPDLSRGQLQEEKNLRAKPLRQEDVEKVSSNFDSLESKAENLAKWLQDQL